MDRNKRVKNRKVSGWVKEIMHNWKKTKGKVGTTRTKSAKKARQIAIAMAFSKTKRGEHL